MQLKNGQTCKTNSIYGTIAGNYLRINFLQQYSGNENHTAATTSRQNQTENS